MRATARRARAVSATVTAACLALVLSACGGGAGADSAGPTTSGGIILAAGTEPQNPLLPTNTNEVGGGLIMNLLFQGLISYDAHGKSINQVAASITTTDSQTFTIKVKAGWTFTYGEAVTARSSSMPGTSVRSLPTTRSTPTSSGPSTATPRFTCQGLTPSPLPGPWSASRWSTP